MIPTNTYSFALLSEQIRDERVIRTFGMELNQWDGAAWVDPSPDDLIKADAQWLKHPDLVIPETVADAVAALTPYGAVQTWSVPQVVALDLTNVDSLLLPQCAVIGIIDSTGTIQFAPYRKIMEGMLLDVSALSGQCKIYINEYVSKLVSSATLTADKIYLDGLYRVHGVQRADGTITYPYTTVAYGGEQTVLSFDPSDLTAIANDTEAKVIVSELTLVSLLGFPQSRAFQIPMELPIAIYNVNTNTPVVVSNLTYQDGLTLGEIPSTMDNVRLIVPEWFGYFVNSFPPLFLQSLPSIAQPVPRTTMQAIDVLINGIANHATLVNVQDAINELFNITDLITTHGLDTVKIVDTIAERDALDELDRHLCWVLDASADPTVTAGAALYLYNTNTSSWSKLSEAESLDLVLNWNNIVGRPTSNPNDIDDAVAKRHASGVNSHAISMIDGLQDKLDYLGGLTENTTVNIPATLTETEVQDLIDALTVRGNGYELRLIFEDGHRVLTKPLHFIGFDGYLRVYGNSADGANVENKHAIFKTVDNGWDTSNDRDDIDGISALFVFYHCNKATVRYIQFDNSNGLTRGSELIGIECKAGTYVGAYYNTFKGVAGTDFSSSSHAFDCTIGSSALLRDNFFGGWKHAIHAQANSHISMTHGKATSDGNQLFNIGEAIYNSSMDLDYNLNPLTTIGDKFSSGADQSGFRIQDIHSNLAAIAALQNNSPGMTWKLAVDGETIENYTGYVFDTSAGDITLNLPVPQDPYSFQFAYKVIDDTNVAKITTNGAKWEGVDVGEGIELDSSKIDGAPVYTGANFGWTETVN